MNSGLWYNSPMPRRETRQSIERALGVAKRKQRLAVEKFAREFGLRRAEIEVIVRRSSRKRPPGMASAPVEPPRGPKPLAGGAAAPLEFGD